MDNLNIHMDKLRSKMPVIKLNQMNQKFTERIKKGWINTSKHCIGCGVKLTRDELKVVDHGYDGLCWAQWGQSNCAREFIDWAESAEPHFVDILDLPKKRQHILWHAMIRVWLVKRMK